MHYDEFKPSHPLSEYVQLIWIMQSESPDDHYPRERILPDGIVEVVFHYGEPFITHRADGSSYVQSAAFAISQMRQFIEIESNGQIGFVAVRFLPWGAYHFFKTSIKKFLDDSIDAETIWPNSYQRLATKIREATDHLTRKLAVEHFLLAQLVENRREDNRVDQAVKLIRQSGGQKSIGQLCQQLEISEKGLQRAFLATVGTTPKVFSRVSRFLYLCSNLGKYRDKSLTDLTYDCGYFDQAHFIKEFKQFSGFTPKQFFERENVGFADL